MITLLNKKSDELGVLSSSLCMIHCIATPFLIAAVPTASAVYHESRIWWTWLDIFFLVISFIAAYLSIRQSRRLWVRLGMGGFWMMLSYFVINERMELMEFPLDMVYFPAAGLIILHLINRRHCRCEVGCCEVAESASEQHH